ncbi:MAG: hypothetical protein AAGC55_28970, partial [Myxococcota bacterium]
SQQVAANAIYDFLVDWMNVQRAIGRFDTFMDNAARADFFRRANAFVAEERAREMGDEKPSPNPATPAQPATQP